MFRGSFFPADCSCRLPPDLLAHHTLVKFTRKVLN
jgi:hypothetical protein